MNSAVSSKNRSAHLPTNWSIAAFYSQAWHVVTTYKQLWLLGFAVMVFAGSSVNLNSSFDSNDFSQNSEVEAQVTQTSDITLEEQDFTSLDPAFLEATDQPLSESEEAESFGELMNFFGAVMAKVNPLAWYLGGLTGTFFVAISLIIYVVAGPWARAALILGVADAVKGVSPDVSKNSVRALDYVKGVFFIGLVPWMVYLVFMLVLSIVALLVGLLLQTFWVSTVLAISVTVALVAGLVLTVATITLGTREAVLFSTGGRIGVTRGWQAAQKGWRKAVSLLFWNLLTELVITIGLFLPAIVTFLLAVANVATGFESMEFDLTVFGLPVVLFIVALVAYFIFKAAYNVFTFTTWHLAHTYLRVIQPATGSYK